MINVSLSFDDGRGDNYRIVKEILEPLRIPATFNITIEYIENIAEEKQPCINKPLSIEEIQAISKNNLFEIAGHGYFHKNDRDNMILGVNKLREWCGLGNKKMGIASPSSEMTEKEIENNWGVFQKENINYVRAGDRIKSFDIVKKLCRKLNRILHIPFIFNWIYQETLLSDEDTYIYYSIPVLNDNNLNEILYLLKNAIKAKKSLILMFHSILKPQEKYYKDLWSWDYIEFLKLCQYLKEYEKEGKIKLCTSIELSKL